MTVLFVSFLALSLTSFDYNLSGLEVTATVRVVRHGMRWATKEG